MDLKKWNENLKLLREMILKPEKLEESKELIFYLHGMVHASEMSGVGETTFEDELWMDLGEDTARTAVNEKGRTVLYGMWHSARIEDITVNMLIAGGEQVFNAQNFQERIHSPIIDTGNALTAPEILEFSREIDISELRQYRRAVGRRTREVVLQLATADMKRKFEKKALDEILASGAVLEVDASRWLVDFWGRKNVAGILLMPATRHHVVHINESMSAKKRAASR